MTWSNPCVRLGAALTLALALVLPAEAASVALVDASYTISTGSSVEINRLQLTGPGTLTLTLTDIPWPPTLSGIQFELTDASGHVLGTTSGFGTSSFAVAGAGTYYAISAGTFSLPPGATVGFGSFGLDLSFTALAPAVPLPAPALLLASGLALAALRRVRGRTAINM
jgi:hypothetical protein